MTVASGGKPAPGFRPSPEFTTPGFQEMLHALDQIGLELVLCMQAFLFFPKLALIALSPGFCAGFVAANMDIGGGKMSITSLSTFWRKVTVASLPMQNSPFL